MIWHRGAASVWVTILHVRAALADKNEAHCFQDATDLARLENWGLRHGLRRKSNALSADELSFQFRLTILQEHLDHFAEIALELLQRFTLRMRASEARNVTDIQASIGTSFDDCREFFHEASVR